MPYKYLRRMPKATSWTQGDIPGHRMGYTRRTDVLQPRWEEYRPYCLCGSKGATWFSSKALAQRSWYDAHIAEVEKQERLF